MPDEYQSTPPPDGAEKAYGATAPYDYPKTPPPDSGDTLPHTPAAPPDAESVESVFRERGYLILSKLGEGSYGSVYKAYNKDRIQIAIKVMKSCSSDDLARYRQEVRFLAQAEGSLGVVGLKADSLDETQYPYFVMQFAVGGPLSKQLGRLKLRKIVRIFRRVVETIHYVHSEQPAEGGREAKPRFIHCDLKPDNILLNAADEPLVADFGLAQLDRNKIRALGSLFYMAPEQTFVNVSPDPKWDVYALGAILYALVVGHAPREDADAGQRIFKSMQREPLSGRAAYREYLQSAPRPEAHWKHVDRRLAEIIDGCIELDPNKRIQNTDEILALLKRRDEWLPHRLIPVTVDFESDRISERTLAEQLQHGPLKPDLAMRIFRQIVEAVQRTHARGIRHEDLRPENIFFRVPHEGEESSLLATPQIGAGTTLETPALGSVPSARASLGFSANQVGYISPELMKDTEPNALEAATRRRAELPVEVRLDDRKFRGDIYSLGALLYAMLTGKPPLYPENLPETLSQEPSIRQWKRIYAERVAHSKVNEHLAAADFDPELKDLVKACLSPEPAKRPKSTTAVLELIDRRSHWRRNRQSFRQLCGLAAAGLAALALLCFYLTRLYLNDARDSRFRQTLQAHEEYIAVSELAVQNRVAESVEFLRTMETQLTEADRPGEKSVAQQLAAESESLRGFWKVCALSRERRLMEAWLEKHFPAPTFKQGSVKPFGLQAIVYDDGEFDSYSVGRIDWEPTETDGQAAAKSGTRYKVPDSSRLRSFSFRSYIHGDAELPRGRRPRDLVRGVTFSNVYQTLVDDKTKQHWMMDISLPIRFEGRTVAVLCTAIYIEPDEDVVIPVTHPRARAFLDYWFDVEKDNYRHITLVNNRGYPVRLPLRLGADNTYYSVPFFNNEDQHWQQTFLGGESTRRFPDLQTKPELTKTETGESAGFYHDPKLPDIKYLAVVKPIRFAVLGDASPTWWMVCTTSYDDANAPIRKAGKRLVLISLFLWLAIAAILGLILYYLYRQLRYGESLRETLGSLKARAFGRRTV